MITIQLKFPTGKWHATPWGRQVNEGAVEWPPSPWRILRALLAVWHHKHFDVSEEQMRTLINALAEEMPVYQLPSTSAGHTRHYMPVANDKRTKIFDTFIALSPEEQVLVHWPNTTLSDEQLALLDSLLRSMSYFGRAESWVEASLSEWEGSPNAVPLNGHEVTQRQELSHLLAPGSIEEYSRWRSSYVEDQQQKRLRQKQAAAEAKGKPTEKIKLTKKDLENIDASIPEDLFASLHMETSELRKSGWNRPPASEYVRYVVDKPENQHLSAPTRKINSLPTVARFAIAGAVLPRLTHTVIFTEELRRRVMGASKKWSRDNTASPVFSGKSLDGTKNSGHTHVHYLTEQPKTESRIKYVNVFASDGFSEDDIKSLERFPLDRDTQRLKWSGHQIQLVLIGLGDPRDFGGNEEQIGESPIFDESDTWTSRTPFVPADQLRRKYNVEDASDRKKYERDLFRIIRKEFARRPWLEAYADKLESVTWLGPQTEFGNTKTSWLKFHQRRSKGGGQRGNTSGVGVKLQFTTAIRGPIAIGYGSHFGLGVFVPERK